jgi:capsular polysaccharide biosynthesis protein
LYAFKDDLGKVDFFLVPEYIQDYQISSLRYFGIEANRIISSLNYKHIIASDLICTSHPRTATFSVRSEIALFLRNKFNVLNENKIDKDKNYPHFFYISRRDAPRRKVNNEEKLILMLQKINIYSIEISNYSLDEVVYLFRNAKLVVSSHSAALTNILFCKPGTKIIECSTKSTFLPYYSELAKVLNLDYHCLLSEIDEIKLYNSRYEIQNEMASNIDISSLYELIAKLKCVD